MAVTNTEAKYGSVSKFFHWTIFLIVITLLTVGFFMHDIPKPTKFFVYTMHKSFGITVLALMALRILWTLTNVSPTYSPSTPKWEIKAAHGLHFLLYVLLLVMPLSGWIASTAADHVPSFFGLFDLPFPGIELNKPFSKIISKVHTIAAWTLVAALSVHVLAALKHHFIDKDTILRRMLPFTK